MDLRFFQKLYEHSTFDEIKAIGKDVVIEGHSGHIIGMTRKEKQVRLYILEQCEPLEDIESYAERGAEEQGTFRAEHSCGEQKVSPKETYMERNRREQMKHSMGAERKRGFFLHIRNFQVGERVLETAGATCGNMQNGDYAEAYLLFTQFLQAGWRVSEDSPFYTAGWRNLAITNIELREEMEQLPEWSDEMWITYDTSPGECAIEQPVTLVVGKAEALSFSLRDGCGATCYINRVCLMDVWAE